MVVLNDIITMKVLIKYYDNHDISEEVIADIAVTIISQYNNYFKQIAEYRGLMVQATEHINLVLVEIEKAIEKSVVSQPITVGGVVLELDDSLKDVDENKLIRR